MHTNTYRMALTRVHKIVRLLKDIIWILFAGKTRAFEAHNNANAKGHVKCLDNPKCHFDFAPN